MSLTSDPVLFEIFESGDISARLEEIIIRSLRVKRYVVQEDEKEQGTSQDTEFRAYARPRYRERGGMFGTSPWRVRRARNDTDVFGQRSEQAYTGS